MPLPRLPLATTLASALTLLSLTASPASAQEWPRFRGPNGAGLSTNPLPARITPDDIHWKVELPGPGHSSPVLWGNKLFLTSTDPQTAKRLVVCLDASDGKLLWTKAYDSQPYRQHKDNSYASSTPAVDDQAVYVLWSTPEQYSLRALSHDGNELWTADLGLFKSQHGSGTSPVVYKDLVIVTKDEEGNNSFVAALDKRTGKEAWRTPRKPGNMAAATPCVLTIDGQDQLVVCSKTEGIAALDPITGKVLWQLPDASPQHPIGSPALYNDIIISASGEGGFGRHLTAVRAGSKDRKPEIVYKKVQAQHPPYVPSPIVVNDLLFTWTDQGVVTCMKAQTGEQLWQEKLPDAKAGFYCSLVAAGDRIYCVSKASELFAVRAADKFEFLGKSDLGVNEICHTTPALAHGRMYVRTLTHLICIAPKNSVAASR